MAPLNHDVAGVILPHDTFGTHLNEKGDTIDKDLDLENFAHAGKILSDIWSHTVIDGFPTVGAYVDSEANMDIIHQDEEWISKHVRQSQFCLQIIKCGDLVCCEPFRSSLLSPVENRFLPPPIPLAQTADGLLWAESEKNTTYAS